MRKQRLGRMKGSADNKEERERGGGDGGLTLEGDRREGKSAG